MSLHGDRLRLLAEQAWRRVQQLNEDPILAIHKALIYATTGKAVPEWVYRLPRTEQATVMCLLPGPQRLRAVTESLMITNRAACLRLRRLRAKGIVAHHRHGTWSLDPSMTLTP